MTSLHHLLRGVPRLGLALGPAPARSCPDWGVAVLTLHEVANLYSAQIHFASKEALRILISFATSDLCEASFSAVAVIRQSIA